MYPPLYSPMRYYRTMWTPWMYDNWMISRAINQQMIAASMMVNVAPSVPLWELSLMTNPQGNYFIAQDPVNCMHQNVTTLPNLTQVTFNQNGQQTTMFVDRRCSNCGQNFFCYPNNQPPPIRLPVRPQLYQKEKKKRKKKEILNSKFAGTKSITAAAAAALSAAAAVVVFRIRHIRFIIDIAVPASSGVHGGRPKVRYISFFFTIYLINRVQFLPSVRFRAQPGSSLLRQLWQSVVIKKNSNLANAYNSKNEKRVLNAFWTASQTHFQRISNAFQMRRRKGF